MTASELIQQLQALPADTKMVVRGYEDGYNDILKLKLVKIIPDKNAPWYLGEYQNSTGIDATPAIELYGKNTNPTEE